MGETLSEGLARLSRFLHELARPYAVIGGIAAIARSRPRFTDDIDVVVVAEPKDGPALLALAKRHGYRFEEKGIDEMVAVGLVPLWGGERAADGVDVDLLFEDSAFYRSLVTRATPLELSPGVVLPVATAEDLVLLKLEADRPVDIDDVLAIKDARADQLDMLYLRSQADQLGLRRKLDLYFPG